jgi:predicted RNA-binding Zn ribbon-like protein
MSYAGPLRTERLAIELHNTVYAVAGTVIDGLADAPSAAAWLDGVAERLPREGFGPPPSIAKLIELRDAIRDVLHDTVAGHVLREPALAAINGFSLGAPRSPLLLPGPAAGTDHHGATRADIVLGAFARNAIELVTGPERGDLRACGAPRCVLMFLKDHPRREWCSNTCGNRARQARHYERTRGRT